MSLSKQLFEALTAISNRASAKVLNKHAENITNTINQQLKTTKEEAVASSQTKETIIVAIPLNPGPTPYPGFSDFSDKSENEYSGHREAIKNDSEIIYTTNLDIHTPEVFIHGANSKVNSNRVNIFNQNSTFSNQELQFTIAGINLKFSNGTLPFDDVVKIEADFEMKFSHYENGIHRELKASLTEPIFKGNAYQNSHIDSEYYGESDLDINLSFSRENGEPDILQPILAAKLIKKPKNYPFKYWTPTYPQIYFGSFPESVSPFIYATVHFYRSDKASNKLFIESTVNNYKEEKIETVNTNYSHQFQQTIAIVKKAANKFARKFIPYSLTKLYYANYGGASSSGSASGSGGEGIGTNNL